MVCLRTLVLILQCHVAQTASLMSVSVASKDVPRHYLKGAMPLAVPTTTVLCCSHAVLYTCTSSEEWCTVPAWQGSSHEDWSLALQLCQVRNHHIDLHARSHPPTLTHLHYIVTQG